MMRMVCVCVLFVLFGALTRPSVCEAASSGATVVARWIGIARTAYAKGDLGRMKVALLSAEKALGQKQRFRKYELEHYALWLHLLWSKFHRIQAVLPPIKRAKQFEDRKQVQAHLKELTRTLSHLKEGHRRLKLYIQLFRQLTTRLRNKDALVLVNTSNQAGILQNRISIVKLRLVRLEKMERQWQSSSEKLRRQRQSQRLKRELKKLRKIRRTQLALKKLMKRQALALRRAQRVYLSRQRSLINKQRTGTTMLWIGAGVLTLSVGAAVTGGWMHAESEAWTEDQSQKKLSTGEARVFKNAGSGMLIGGAIALITGLTVAIVGLSWRPGAKQRAQGVYDAHRNYIEWDSKERDNTQQSHLGRRPRQRVMPLPSAPFRTTLLAIGG